MSPLSDSSAAWAGPSAAFAPDALLRIGRDCSVRLADTFHDLAAGHARRRADHRERQRIAVEGLLHPILAGGSGPSSSAAGRATVRPTGTIQLRQRLDHLGGRERTRFERPSSPLAKASVLRSGEVAADVQLAFDTQLQVLGPPYVDHWTDRTTSDNAEATVWVNPGDGSFGFTHGAAGGSAAGAAAVWTQFVPDGPLPRPIEVRPYAPYDYQWDDLSDNGYVAHNDAGFGVFVLSWDFSGQDQRVEQDYRYSLWSDGTGWYEEHHNASWDGSDSDVPFVFGREAPYFTARPGRVYRAATWCFGSCDADGGFFGNAVSAASVRAVAGFVVVGEST